MRRNPNSDHAVPFSRKLVKVFDSYGIDLKPRQRNLHLKNDLHMDDVVIHGLIFELELASGNLLEKDYRDLELRPARLIEEFAV